MKRPKTFTPTKNKAKDTAKHSVWVCACGFVLPTRGAVLSGDSSYKYGFHVHCPKCGKVVAQFVDPKVTQ